MKIEDSPYVVGKNYYRVTYLDSNQSCPRIETFVYIGLNLSDDDYDDTWYFQFIDSCVEHGSPLEGREGEFNMRLVKSDNLSEMLSVDQLATELEAAEQRRK